MCFDVARGRRVAEVGVGMGVGVGHFSRSSELVLSLR